MKRPSIAKLSRPRLYDAMARDRLLKRLDQARRHACVWVCGPPGSGKTTLVANWIRDRSVPDRWYRMDAGDADPATFFAYLIASAQGLGQRGKALPYLSTDYANDLSGFARAFFRAYFQRLPKDAVLVFDNVQEASCEALGTILRKAIDEVPEDISLMIISRQPPPEDVYGHLMNRSISVLDWGELRFDAGEVADLLARSRPADPMVAAQLMKATDGWVAGLVLMIAADSGSPRASVPLGMESKDLIFGYFAAEVLSGMPELHQRLLMRTALLPHVTPDAAMTLSGVPDAQKVLDRLFRTQYFVDRHSDPTLSYRYHDLFRHFLMDRGSRTFPGEEWCDVQLRTAEYLLNHGEEDLAMELFARVGAHQKVASIVELRARHLMAQGRWQTLLRWLSALPEDTLNENPWILYWKGVALAVSDIRLGRETLAKAAAMFRQRADQRGQLLTASTIVDSYFQEWDSVGELDPWLDKLLEGLAISDSTIPDETRFSAEASLMIGLLHRRPGHPRLKPMVERIAARVAEETNASERLRQYTFLLFYYDLMGEFAKAYGSFQPALPLIEDAAVAPRIRLWAISRQMHHHAMLGDSLRAVAHATHALALSQESGVTIAPAFLYIDKAQAFLSDGHGEQAWEWIERARPLLSAKYELESVYFLWLEVWAAVMIGNYPVAQRLWDAFAARPMVGVPFNTPYNLPAIMLLCQRGDYESALSRVTRWRGMLADMGSPWLNYNLDLMEAYVHLHRGDDDVCLHALARAMDLAATHDFRSNLAWLPAMMSPLLAKALEAGIQVGFVESLIRQRGLSAPEDAICWPWPVKIFALGRLLIVRDGQPVRFAHKPQQRTLELLKAILARGPDGALATDLVDCLWPDSEGDLGYNALTVTLSRLRKLLGRADAVLLEAGSIRLNKRLCWVDAFEFDRRSGKVQSAASVAHPSKAEVDALLALYCGHFLADAAGLSWTFKYRDRLKSRYLRLIVTAGARLEDQARWREAVELYGQARETDSVQEEISRGLMRCYRALGEKSEALHEYHRCRRALSAVLGVQPSAETEALAMSLR